MANPEQVSNNIDSNLSGNEGSIVDPAIISTEHDSDRPLPELPRLTRSERRAVCGDFLGVGTLEQAIGKEEAEKVFARTRIYEIARQSAAYKLRTGNY